MEKRELNYNDALLQFSSTTVHYTAVALGVHRWLWSAWRAPTTKIMLQLWRLTSLLYIHRQNLVLSYLHTSHYLLIPRWRQSADNHEKLKLPRLVFLVKSLYVTVYPNDRPVRHLIHKSWRTVILIGILLCRRWNDWDPFEKSHFFIVSYFSNK